MCMIKNPEKLKQLQKKKSITAYKIVTVSTDGKLCPVYNWGDFNFNENRNIWDCNKNYDSYIYGFSVFLNKKNAIKVLHNCTIIQDIPNLCLYKVKVSNVVAAGKWKYKTEPHPFNNFNIAEVEELEFLEKIM